MENLPNHLASRLTTLQDLCTEIVNKGKVEESQPLTLEGQILGLACYLE